MSTKSEFERILQQVLIAYKDAHEETVGGERNLNFLAPAPVTGSEYVAIMSRACPDGYNFFDKVQAENVRAVFGDDAEYYIAREGSVCVYIKTKHLRMNEGLSPTEFKADELSFDSQAGFRVWWD